MYAACAVQVSPRLLASLSVELQGMSLDLAAADRTLPHASQQQKLDKTKQKKKKKQQEGAPGAATSTPQLPGSPAGAARAEGRSNGGNGSSGQHRQAGAAVTVEASRSLHSPPVRPSASSTRNSLGVPVTDNSSSSTSPTSDPAAASATLTVGAVLGVPLAVDVAWALAKLRYAPAVPWVTACADAMLPALPVLPLAQLQLLLETCVSVQHVPAAAGWLQAAEGRLSMLDEEQGGIGRIIALAGSDGGASGRGQGCGSGGLGAEGGLLGMTGGPAGAGDAVDGRWGQLATAWVSLEALKRMAAGVGASL